MNPYNFSVLCFGFCSLLLGLLIWLKRQDEIGQRYFLMSFFYSGWAIFIAINLNNDVSQEVGLFTGRLGNAFAVFIPVTWYHFVLVFVGNSKNRHFLKLLYASSVAIACFSFTPWFIAKAIPMVGFRYYSQAGPIFCVSALIFFIIVPLSFVELYKKLKNSGGHERAQIRGLFFTALIGYIGGSPTFFPIFGIPFPQYTLLLLPIYPFALAYFMTKQKLFDLEELAQAAHKDKLTAIGALVASINHEVRNPLFIIKGLAETWLERKRAGVFENDKQGLEKGEESFARAIDQADRVMDIIKRLSLFAKAGIEGEMKFEDVSVAEVLENVLPLVRYELAAHNIALTRDIPPNIPDVYADRRYLEEIFFNLIVNATQAIKETGKPGEIKVSAIAPSPSLSRGERDGVRGSHSVIITIFDTGPGIPEDKLKDVFRPFYTTKAEGTGLGLYITKQLVGKIRGKVEVSSKEGIGTTFTLLFSAYELTA